MFGANAFGWVYFGEARIQYYFADTDSAALSESELVSVPVSESDSASFSESQTITASLGFGDTSGLTDAQKITAFSAESDTASLSETFEIIIGGVPITKTESDTFILSEASRVTIQLIVGARSRNWGKKRVDDEELLEILAIAE